VKTIITLFTLAAAAATAQAHVSLEQPQAAAGSTKARAAPTT